MKTLVCVVMACLLAGCCATEKRVLREGMYEAVKEPLAEYVKWAEEKQVKGELTADDLRIRKNSIARYNELVEADRNNDGN